MTELPVSGDQPLLPGDTTPPRSVATTRDHHAVQQLRAPVRSTTGKLHKHLLRRGRWHSFPATQLQPERALPKIPADRQARPKQRTDRVDPDSGDIKQHFLQPRASHLRYLPMTDTTL